MQQKENETKAWQHDLINRSTLSSFVFSWVTRLIRYTIRSHLTDPEDTFLLSEDLKADFNVKQLQRLWDEEEKRYRDQCRSVEKLDAGNPRKLKPPQPPRLAFCLMRMFSNLLAQAGFFVAVQYGALLVSAAYLVGELIDILERFEADEEPVINIGSLDVPYR